MIVDVKIPEAGESITEGYLATWSVPDGAAVAVGDALFEFETDKTTLEVSAPAAGRLAIAVSEGTDVTVGQVVATVDTDAAEAPAAAPAAEEAESPAGSPNPEPPPPPTPSALRQAAVQGVDPGTLAGTGKGGRVTKADVADAAKLGRGTPPASPPAGEIPTSKAVPGTEVPPPVPAPAPTSATETERREPLSRIRRKIAENLAHTQETMVLLTTFNEIDMSRVMDLRARHKEEFAERHGTKLGFMSFFLKAGALGLRDFPDINAVIDGDEVVRRDHIHISVAVSTEKGLITPVVKFVDLKSFADIESEIIGFARRAAAKTLLPDELIGGTFTVTNGGVFGSLLSTPLPSPNQSAILGMHAIQERPVAVDGQVVVRPMMNVALTYDHRLVDGREAVGFLKTVKNAVEDPERLLLDI